MTRGRKTQDFLERAAKVVDIRRSCDCWFYKGPLVPSHTPRIYNNIQRVRGVFGEDAPLTTDRVYRRIIQPKLVPPSISYLGVPMRPLRALFLHYRPDTPGLLACKPFYPSHARLDYAVQQRRCNPWAPDRCFNPFHVELLLPPEPSDIPPPELVEANFNDPALFVELAEEWLANNPSASFTVFEELYLTTGDRSPETTRAGVRTLIETEVTTPRWRNYLKEWVK